MKLFTVGPVQMYPSTLEVSSQQLPYFRTNEFSQIMLTIEKQLKQIVGTQDNSKVAIITGSGTSAMEAVVASSFNKDDCLLIINGGTFGARFVQLCQIYQIPYDEVNIPYGNPLTKELLDEIDGTKYSGLLVNIHETSTGQLYDIEILSNFVKKYQLYFVVDAISSFLADRYEMDYYNIDCTILSSQKALSLSPGLSMVILNKRMYDNKVKNKAPINLYLNLNEYIKNMERGQTPNTPAVGIVLELEDMLKGLDKDSVQKKIAETKDKADYFRQKALALGLTIPKFGLSNALTPLVFPNGNAYKVYEYLKDTYDIYITPNGGDLQTTVVRVGHLGNIEKVDYDQLLEHMKEVL